MTPSRLVKLGAALQRMADRLANGHIWRLSDAQCYVDHEGIMRELTEAGWQSVIS